MKIFGQVVTLGIVIAALSTGIASATIRPADPCAESVSCTLHHTLGTATIAQPRLPSAAKSTTADCGINVGCIKAGIDYGGIHPIQPSPDVAPASSESFSQSLLRMSGLQSLFARFFSN